MTSECPACHRSRDAEIGCNGSQVNAARYGDEQHWTDGTMDGYVPQPRCADCRTPLGEHHHANCLQARCLHCAGQAVGCDHARVNGYAVTRGDLTDDGELADPGGM